MRRLLLLSLSICCLGWAAAAQAAETPLASDNMPLEAEPLDLDQLSDISGGQAMTVVSTDQNLTALNTGNSITAASVRSGDINFSDQALSNFAGIGNFVVNTGANNILQGSLSVTVVAAPSLVR